MTNRTCGCGHSESAHWIDRYPGRGGRQACSKGGCGCPKFEVAIEPDAPGVAPSAESSLAVMRAAIKVLAGPKPGDRALHENEELQLLRGLRDMAVALDDAMTMGAARPRQWGSDTQGLVNQVRDQRDQYQREAKMERVIRLGCENEVERLRREMQSIVDSTQEPDTLRLAKRALDGAPDANRAREES